MLKSCLSNSFILKDTNIFVCCATKTVNVHIRVLVCMCLICIICLSYLSYLFLWPPCVADADIIFLPCSFYLLLLSFFIPRLISAAADWMSTILLHMVWP